MLEVYDNKIWYERRNEKVCIFPWGKDTLRFVSAPDGNIINENWNLLPPDYEKWDECETEAYIEDGMAIIKNGIMKAVLHENGKVIYYKNNKIILEEMTENAFDAFYRTYRARGDSSFEANILFKPDKEEHFYGLGQEANDCFDMKGSTSNLEHRNTKSSIPFVYSSKGYGFLWNNPAIGRCELANNRYKWTVYKTKQVDYLVIGGENPGDVMSKYADIMGHTPKFPEFASGFWQSKLRYESSEDLLEVAKEYKRRNIPISVIVIDYFHWTQQGDWKFEPSLWKDVEGMVKELDKMGIKLMVSIWPTTNPQSENYKYMDDRNMILRTENGLYGMQDFYGQQDYIDTLKEETRDYVWDIIKKNYYDRGIKYFWLDEAEPGLVPNHYDNIRCCRGNFSEFALLYPYYYAKMFYDGLKEAGEEEIITLERAAYAGISRYGALIWSGDLQSTFDNLRKSVKTGLNMAMSGISWWTTDIGGFWGGDTESEYFRELIIRWFQFGVFCPVTRLHGVRVKQKGHVDRHPGIPEMSGGDNEIWSFGKKDYEILKNLIELREKLRPYVMKYMDIAQETGSPIMRPMFYDFPEDKICYELDDQYMFGKDILFAPITEQGCTQRNVYLPEGNWICVTDKKEYAGNNTVNIHADINEYIAFVKKDSKVREIFNV